ncbi:MAG TPA: 2OG-Fe(II) oxygenase [Tepidisphaeraceae bacterium]|jgi:PKHD-type hydroxylase|nr:2OG-Fe(II) oxygenase [Tepidisphaeraceae bacterium]
MYLFPLEQSQYYQNYAFREKFFSPEECDRVLALLNQYPLQDAVAPRADNLAYPRDVRKSRVASLPWIKDAEWIFQRLTAAVMECNKSLYNFQLAGFMEGLRIDEYQAGSFYDWHQDFGYREQSIRKISLIAQLTEPSQYQGGDVEFFSGRGPQKAVRARGAILLFPSFVLHRVAPMTAGTRHALVGWVAGPPFR